MSRGSIALILLAVIMLPRSYAGAEESGNAAPLRVRDAESDEQVDGWTGVVIRRDGRRVMRVRGDLTRLARGAARAPEGSRVLIVAEGYRATLVPAEELVQGPSLQRLSHRTPVEFSVVGKLEETPKVTVLREVYSSDGSELYRDEMKLQLGWSDGALRGKALVDESRGALEVRTYLRCDPTPTGLVWPQVQRIDLDSEQVTATIEGHRRVTLGGTSPGDRFLAVLDDVETFGWPKSKGDAYAFHRPHWSLDVERVSAGARLWVPRVDCHVFRWRAGEPNVIDYLSLAATDRRASFERRKPRVVASRPIIGGSPAPSGSLLVPGRVSADALGRLIGDSKFATDVVVEVDGEWRPRAVPDAAAYTAWHRDHGIAYLEWTEEGSLAGDWGPGAATWRAPAGFRFSGEVLYRTRPPGTAKVFTWRIGGILMRPVQPVERATISGLPRGFYVTVIHGALHPERGTKETAIPVHYRALIDLTAAQPRWEREIPLPNEPRPPR